MTILGRSRAILLITVLALAAAPALAAASSAPVRLPTGNACKASAAVRPAEVVLSCADGNEYVGGITWSSWTATSASGTGRLTYNNCTPDCAGGVFLSVAASVAVSDPRTISGQLLFTHLVITKSDRSTLTLNWSAYGTLGNGNWVPTATHWVLYFSPSAHRAALLSLLDTKTAGQKVNELTLYPSPLNSYWVLYHAGLATSGGEDNAEGYAHFVAGHWIDVFGPASGFCSAGAIPGVSAAMRASLAYYC